MFPVFSKVPAHVIIHTVKFHLSLYHGFIPISNDTRQSYTCDIMIYLFDFHAELYLGVY
jgi:hypothetical protein